jgi:hypothetical protein
LRRTSFSGSYNPSQTKPVVLPQRAPDLIDPQIRDPRSAAVGRAIDDRCAVRNLQGLGHSSQLTAYLLFELTFSTSSTFSTYPLVKCSREDDFDDQTSSCFQLCSYGRVCRGLCRRRSHADRPQSRAVNAVGANPYTPPKTPWGDPDIQGTYTNKDENGIPMERPSQFDGKKLEDVDDSSEFADIVRERNERALASAAGIGGRDTGAGPVHWYEHYGAKNSRAWLVTGSA